MPAKWSIFLSFTGRDSRKPSGVYGFKSVSICQIAVRIIRQIAMIAFLCPRRALILLDPSRPENGTIPEAGGTGSAAPVVGQPAGRIQNEKN